MKKRLSFLLIILLGVFVSCQKQPVALFSTDKSEYSPGEQVILTNNSIDAKSFKWTISDGQSSVDKNLIYNLSSNQQEGIITFTLKALSRTGKKVSYTSKNITVKKAYGNVTFWQISNSGYGVTVVTIDGVSSNITNEYTGVPSACGAAGCAVFNNLTVGNHIFSATDGTYTWNGTVNITNGGCTRFQLK
jgi:hypothetical protein